MREQRKGAGSKSPWTRRFILVMLSSYLVIFASAYTVASLNAPAQYIKEFMNSTAMSRNGSPLSHDQVESKFGLLVAVCATGGVIGCFTGSFISDAIGRKPGILLCSVTGCLGVLLMALSKLAGYCEMLFVGRAVAGLTAGWSLTMAPSFVAEMCLPEMKGVAVLINQLCQSFAFIVAQILGYQEMLGTERLWPFLLGMPVVVFVLHIASFSLKSPESPRYLLLKKEDEEGAKKALRALRGKYDVGEDVQMLYSELEESRMEAQVSIKDLFTTPSLRRPLVTAIVMGLHQNWSGVNAIFFFSTQLFEDIGVTGKASRYATSGTGITFFVFNIAALVLMKTVQVGRKLLFIAGALGMGVCSSAVALTSLYKDDVDALKYVNVLLSLTIVALFAAGPVSVLWVMLSELFPHSARAAGVGVAVLCTFIGFFTHCYAFPEMLNSMKSHTFYVFTGVNAATALFIYVYVPETVGRTFADIVNACDDDLDKETDV